MAWPDNEGGMKRPQIPTHYWLVIMVNRNGCAVVLE